MFELWIVAEVIISSLTQVFIVDDCTCHLFWVEFLGKNLKVLIVKMQMHTVEMEPILFQIKKKKFGLLCLVPLFEDFGKGMETTKKRRHNGCSNKKRVNSNKKLFYKFSLSGFRPRCWRNKFTPKRLFWITEDKS
jgi:hypothetical protein